METSIQSKATSLDQESRMKELYERKSRWCETLEDTLHFYQRKFDELLRKEYKFYHGDKEKYIKKLLEENNKLRAKNEELVKHAKNKDSTMAAQQEEILNIRSSLTWKLGRIVTKPIGTLIGK